MWWAFVCRDADARQNQPTQGGGREEVKGEIEGRRERLLVAVSKRRVIDLMPLDSSLLLS